MAQVEVIQSTEVGIHLSIDKVEYGFNKSTNTFKQRKAGGKFVTITPTAYIRAICKNQFEAAARNKKAADTKAWVDSLKFEKMTETELRAARTELSRREVKPWLKEHINNQIGKAILNLDKKPYEHPIAGARRYSAAYSNRQSFLAEERNAGLEFED